MSMTEMSIASAQYVVASLRKGSSVRESVSVIGRTCVPCFTARTRACSKTSPSADRLRESGEGVVGRDENCMLDIIVRSAKGTDGGEGSG